MRKMEMFMPQVWGKAPYTLPAAAPHKPHAPLPEKWGEKEHKKLLPVLAVN